MSYTGLVELKPCPFCGNDGNDPTEEALHIVFTEHDWRDASWSVQCDKCTATMGYSDSEDEAIAAWNTRPDAIEALTRPKPVDVEAVAKAIEGPHCPVPQGAGYTLADLRQRRWNMLLPDEKQARLNEAQAALAAMEAPYADG